MLSAPLYLLLTISIVGKCADCYVVDNSASMKNVAKSETDDRRTAYFDSNNNNEVDNHIRTSAINGSVSDNAMEMPKPSDAVDYVTSETSKGPDDALATVGTGKLLISNVIEYLLCDFIFTRLASVHLPQRENEQVSHRTRLNMCNTYIKFRHRIRQNSWRRFA